MSIFSVIAKVSSELVGRLTPDKRNTQQNYDYISADLILQEAGRAMAQNGLVIIPSITDERIETVEYTDSYGKQKTRYDAAVVFSMVMACEDEQVIATWAGRGSDYAVPDKATYKAITSGHKYFLMKLFNIGVGNEDGEHEPVEQVTSTRKPVTSQPKPAPKAQAPAPANVGGPSRDAEAVKVALIAASMSGSASPAGEKQLKFTRASLSSLTGDNHADASAIIRYVFGVDSSTKLTGGQASALIDWAGANKDNGYKVNPTSVIEARGIVNAQLVADGQGSLFDDEPNGAYQE